MALAELRAAGLPLPPPHPATKATRSNAKNHLSVLVIISNLFIMLLLYLIQKNICAIVLISAVEMLREYASLNLVCSSSKLNQPEPRHYSLQMHYSTSAYIAPYVNCLLYTS